MAKSFSIKTFFKGLVFFLIVVAAAVYAFTFIANDVTSNEHDYVYELPFKPGTSHTVVQGYGGLFSHSHAAALDFSMPVGTGIYAAREGEVYAYKDIHDEGGPFPSYKRKANYIMIKHSDESIGCYWHLKKDGVVTKSGMVKKGELIGYSGYTGFTLRPHLHFSVKKKLSYHKESFVKTKFRTDKGIVFLKNKKKYSRPEN